MKLSLDALKRRRSKPAAAGSYRVALHGFSDFERNALAFCFKHAATRIPAYLQVERAADADFIVADASHEALATSVTRGARMRDTLFVGPHAPAGARSHVERPIDPERILRELDTMAAERASSRPAAGRPDIELPMTARESDFPALDAFDLAETTPAAFEHAPVLVDLADLPPIPKRRLRDGAPQPEPSASDGEAEATPDTASEPAPGPVPQASPAPPSAAAPSAPRASAPPALRLDELPQRPPKKIDPADAPRQALGRAQAPSVPLTTPPEAAPAAAANTTIETPAVVEHATPTAAERAEAKAAVRRRVRRARMAQAGHTDQPALRHVLLLGPDRVDAALGAQLEAFGFELHHARYSADALALITELPLAAVFLDVEPGSDEDMDGLELCMEIKRGGGALAGAVPPVFLLANRDSAAGRVRAKLAGCDALLIRPVTRGDAARALEACDVPLPQDERHADRP